MNYRETITRRAEFDYLHKKQSGGQGQYGRVVGYMEPLPEGSSEKFEYANEIVGNAIPPNYLPSCKKGFEEAVNSGKQLLFIPQRLCNGSDSGLHGCSVTPRRSLCRAMQHGSLCNRHTISHSGLLLYIFRDTCQQAVYDRTRSWCH